MTSFIIRRALQALVLIKCVLIFVFLLLHISGDPISVMLPEEATKEEEALLRKQYGFDKPLIVQYGMFFSKVLKGSFGDSFETEEPALGLVLSHMPATIQLAGTAFIVSILIVSCILIYVIQVFGDSLCKNICKRKISPHVLENTDE